MRRLLIIYSILLLSTATIKANDAFLGSRGGNVFPIIRNENIQMVKEEIRINLEKDSCIVHCKFWFQNHGNKRELALMGFPDYFSDVAQNSIPLRGFTCTVNGQTTKIEKRTQTTEIENIPDLKSYEKWYCWNAQINAGETILVENSYVGDWGGSVDGTCRFAYLIGTAQTWSSNIASGKVIFDYSRIASSAFVDTCFYSDKTLPKGLKRSIYADSIVFSYQEYLPKWDETLRVSIYSFWKCPAGTIHVGTKELPSTFQSRFINQLDKEKLRLMRNEVFARNGYLFKDPELQKYFAGKAWYKPNSDFKSENLNSYEVLFVNYLKKLESQISPKI